MTCPLKRDQYLTQRFGRFGRAADLSLVTQGLTDINEVFAEIKPYQQKKLVRLVLHKAILSPDYMKMALYGRPPEVGPLSGPESRFQTFDWLPGLQHR